MTTEEEQHRQFQARIQRVSARPVDADRLRQQQKPIADNGRFLMIIGGVVIAFAGIGYLTSIGLQFKAAADAAAMAEEQAKPIAPKIIQLDSTATK